MPPVITSSLRSSLACQKKQHSVDDLFRRRSASEVRFAPALPFGN